MVVFVVFLKNYENESMWNALSFGQLQKLIHVKLNSYFLDFCVFKVWKERWVFKSIFIFIVCLLSLFDTCSVFRKWLSFLCICEVWGAFAASLLFEIDSERANLLSSSRTIFFVCKKWSRQFYFHWVNIQLFHHIFIALEYYLVGNRMHFNGDLTSYF